MEKRFISTPQFSRKLNSEIFVLVRFLVQGSFGRAASESLLVEEKLESETSDESVPCKM